MADFLSTLFSGGAEREAADRNRAALGQYQTQGLGYLDSGLNRSSGYLNQAVGAYDQLNNLAGQYRQGSNLYLNALGVNGADAARTAQESFTTSPGYQAGIDAGIDVLNRRRAAGGMLSSGNADVDALTYGQNQQNQQYNSWLDRLSGINNNALSATGTTAAGQAGGYTNLSNLYQTDAQNRVNLAGNVTSGNISANNQQAQGESQGARNLLGGVTSLASLAAGGLGGGFGFGGGGLSSLGGMGLGSGTGRLY